MRFSDLWSGLDRYHQMYYTYLFRNAFLLINNLPSRQSMLDMLNARVRENEEANVLENEFNEPEGPSE